MWEERGRELTQRVERPRVESNRVACIALPEGTKKGRGLHMLVFSPLNENDGGGEKRIQSMNCLHLSTRAISLDPHDSDSVVRNILCN
jgi:hypothetical protein